MSGVGESLPLKWCPPCEAHHPRTSEFWNKLASAPDGLQYFCKGYYSNYRKANRERIAATQKANYEANRESIRERERRRYERNREKNLEGFKAYYQRNRETILGQKKLYYVDNRGRILESKAVYGRCNPDKIRARGRNRHARKRNAPGVSTARDVAAKYELQGGLCYYCKVSLDGTVFHVDHKIPLVRGGSNWPANLCCACGSCNLRKGSQSFWDFLESSSQEPKAGTSGAEEAR